MWPDHFPSHSVASILILMYTHIWEIEEVYYHVHDKLLYHLGELCIPQCEKVNLIGEARTSLITGHFGVRFFFLNYRGIVIDLV